MNWQTQLSEQQIFLVQREGEQTSGQTRLLVCASTVRLTQKHPCPHGTPQPFWHFDSGPRFWASETNDQHLDPGYSSWSVFSC